MQREITTLEKINKLPWSIATNAGNTVFVQLTYYGSAFVLFLNALSFSKSQVGLLLSLLEFSGLVAFLFTPWIVRVGFNRAYLGAFGFRTLVTAGLVLVPWMAGFGPQAAFIYVIIIVGLFAILRSIGITAFYPWAQEYVPNVIRGRYSATNNLTTSLVGFISVMVAGTVLDQFTGLSGYQVLFSVAVLFGAFALWTGAKRPGGEPASQDETSGSAFRDVKEAVRDRDFLRYLAGSGLMSLAIAPLNSFVPLFLKEQVGLSDGAVVYVQTGSLIGALLSTTFWGWASDRYGSRPVMLGGVLGWALLPIGWALMPRSAGTGFTIALVLAFIMGIANMAWAIGSSRLLYNRIVPPEKKTGYLAFYSAALGATGGLSLLLGGLLVEFSAGISGQYFFLRLDPYFGLFVIGLVLIFFSVWLLRGVQGDAPFTVDQFASLFIRGNPLTAVTSMIRHHLIHDERGMIAATTRLGDTRSPLVVEELLASLADPRLSVRMEAITAIARIKPDPRLTQGLIEVSQGTELALSANAIWALGRIGDPAAIPALRESLNSPFRSLRAHAARALGVLNDGEVGALLLGRLQVETDRGLQMAYASALGHLGVQESVPVILDTLEEVENEGARLELALALARMVGPEDTFIQLVEQARSPTGAGTALAQHVIGLKKKMSRGERVGELEGGFRRAGDAFAYNDLVQGAILIGELIQDLVDEESKSIPAQILRACAAHMGDGDGRVEYVYLALHILDTVWSDIAAAPKPDY